MRWRFAKRLLLCLAIATPLTGCADRTIQSAPEALVERSYVDLQPGWLVRVITPILKSGNFKVQLHETAGSGNSRVLTTGDDFLGFETSYYAVKAHEQGPRHLWTPVYQVASA